MIRSFFRLVNVVTLIFMVMGLASTIGMFVLDWKMAFCIIGLLWADRFLRGGG